jgi:hypothetical protein
MDVVDFLALEAAFAGAFFCAQDNNATQRKVARRGVVLAMSIFDGF